MIESIEEIFLKYKDKIAYIIKNEYITYEDLFKTATKYSVYLKKQGTEPVIIYGCKSIDMFVSIFACILANRAYIPLDISTPLLRIEQIINISKASLIIRNRPLNINKIDNVTLGELVKYDNENIKNSNNDIVYIIFTSGSTGEPKGVPISRTNLNSFIKWISNIEPLNEYKNINVLNQATFSFDLSVADIFYSIYNGHTLVSLDTNIQQEYEEIFMVLKKNKINLGVLTPTFIKLCLLNNEFNKDNYPDLKCLYFCGELLEIKTVSKIFERFPDIKIINAYGPTEATSAISGIVITKDMLDKAILPVGDVNKLATDVIIINNEIILKGDSVFNGYLDNIKGGYYKEKGINCYKTGDIGYIKNNLLYCKGRLDSQIKYKGYRIDLMDIELNLKKIDNVKDAAVVCKYNNEGIVKSIKAFVVGNKDCNYYKEELEKVLPNYMIPKIKLIEILPINKNGKIDRKALSDV